MKKIFTSVVILSMIIFHSVTAFAASGNVERSNTWAILLLPAILVAVIIFFIIKITKARKELNIKSSVFKDIQDGKVNSDHQYIKKDIDKFKY